MTVWLELERHIDKGRRGVVRTVASESRPVVSRTSFPLSRLRVKESLDAFLTIDRRELEMVIMDDAWITRMYRNWQMLMKLEDVDSLYLSTVQ